MSELNLQTVQSQSLNAPVRFEDSAGTEIGTLCRAWVNFNGTGTVAIRASFNVSSITDNGTGDYTVNFTTAMPDASYAASVEARDAVLGSFGDASSSATKTASSYRFQGARNAAGGLVDTDQNTVAIFR